MNLSNSTLGMAFEIVYNDNVYQHQPLKKTLDRILNTYNFHITLIHTYEDFKEEIEEIAKDLINHKNIKFFPKGKDKTSMQLDCKHEQFGEIYEKIRKSELRGFDKFEIKTGKKNPDNDLHILFPNIDDINFMFGHINHIKPVSIYLKKTKKNKKIFEYSF